MNVSSLKTPGVYINEIDAFPPSVANVATAIPAFVGYTEKGPSEPTRITSMLEYEQIFGGAPQPASISIVLDENNLPTDASEVKESKFKLYNSMNLFYANGGGVCYIVSIGNYFQPDKNVTVIEQDHFFKSGDATIGLGKLEKKDEVTLLLFPDAINLTAEQLGAVQKAALAQCEKLMDRFVIMDVLQKDGLIQDSLAFRDGVGTSSLKYGASYYPYLKTSTSVAFKFKDINGADKINFKAIHSSNTKLKESIENFEKLQNDMDAIVSKWYPTPPNADKKLTDEVDDENINENYKKCWDLLKILGNTSDVNFISGEIMKSYVDEQITQNLKQHAQALVDFKFAYEELKGDDGTTPVDTLGDLDTDTSFLGSWGTISAYSESSPNPFSGEAIGTFFEKVEAIEEDLGNDIEAQPEIEAHHKPDFIKIQAVAQKIHAKILNSMDNLVSDLQKAVANDESILTGNIPNYSTILAKLSTSFNTLPPSGAMAGVYARVDATRGVWKSPANVSVNGIVGLTQDLNDADQMDMNVHETGKSINAIRYFTGKGFLVWGGRTLAGNSNDWRYINVRRLANMMEESIKKACMNFVFEPNVSQTWVNLKGMIENALTTFWNDGALAGSKPEHAFFVQVGLGQTMTSQDINEGRLIVKIGYAPSKPAEFIILEFKQMQQRS